MIDALLWAADQDIPYGTIEHMFGLAALPQPFEPELRSAAA